jgi:hypothetical protein
MITSLLGWFVRPAPRQSALRMVTGYAKRPSGTGRAVADGHQVTKCGSRVRSAYVSGPVFGFPNQVSNHLAEKKFGNLTKSQVTRLATWGE